MSRIHRGCQAWRSQANEPGSGSGRTRRRRWRRWAQGGLRAAGAASVVGALLALLGLRAAVAGVQEAAASGSSLLEAQLGDGLIEAQELELNGQRVFVSSAVTELGLGQVLDRFEAECSGPGGADRSGVQLLRSALLRRAQNDGEGHLACLALRRELQTAPELVDAVRSFGRSGDLDALGAARVVRVRARPEGGSHVLAFWTEGGFRPFELLSPTRVTTASDGSGVPLPAGTVQDVSLRAPGHPYGLQAYRVPLPLDQALEHYRRGLLAAGYTALEPAVAGLDWREPGKDAHVLLRGSAAVYLVGVEGSAGTRVLVMQSAAGSAAGPVGADAEVARANRAD